VAVRTDTMTYRPIDIVYRVYRGTGAREAHALSANRFRRSCLFQRLLGAYRLNYVWYGDKSDSYSDFITIVARRLKVKMLQNG